MNHRPLSTAALLPVLAALILLPATHVWGSGACCLEDGQCVQATHVQCLNMGGVFSGEGSSCEYVDCFGACCLPDGSCDDGLTKQGCQQLGGSFKGNGLQCSEIVCEIRGACCLGDGGCEPDTNFFYCTNTLGGMWMGHGSLCFGPDAISCLGGCCFDDGDCVSELSQHECEDAGGQFNDFGSQCGEGGMCDLSDPSAVNAVVQRRAFNFVAINNVDRTFAFDKFDDWGGSRQLRKVLVDIDGHVMLVAVLHNTSDAPLNVSDAVYISEDVTVRFSDNVSYLPIELTSIWTPQMPIVDMLLECAGDIVMPGQFCAFSSPLYFPGGGNGFDPRPAGKHQFAVDAGDGLRSMSSFHWQEDDPAFSVILNVTTSMTTSIAGQGSFRHSPHRAMGTIRVTYEYDLVEPPAPIGRCCLMDGSCMEVVEADCLAEDLYFGWQEGAVCASSDACEVAGACCVGDGECLGTMSEANCSRQAHSAGFAAFTFHATVSCAAAIASGLCDPVDDEPILGACCLCDGDCMDGIEEEDCAAIADAASLPAYQFRPNMTCTEAAAAGLCGLETGSGSCCIGPICFASLDPIDCAQFADGVWLPCQDCEGAGCDFMGACILSVGTCTILPQGECIAMGGNFLGVNTICNLRSGGCAGDANGDHRVDIQDLLMVLTNWGPDGGYGDLNSDGAINHHDLLIVIHNWGSECNGSAGPDWEQ